MKKYFCDACKNEIETGVYSLKVLVHITEVEGRGYGLVVSRDPLRTEDTSGREVEHDLCLSCYNKVQRAAYSKFKEIKMQNES